MEASSGMSIYILPITLLPASIAASARYLILGSKFPLWTGNEEARSSFLTIPSRFRIIQAL